MFDVATIPGLMVFARKLSSIANEVASTPSSSAAGVATTSTAGGAVEKSVGLSVMELQAIFQPALDQFNQALQV